MKLDIQRIFPTSIFCFDDVLEQEYIDSMKEDIINQISFKINISKNLKKISQNIYFDKKIGLKKKFKLK